MSRMTSGRSVASNEECRSCRLARARSAAVVGGADIENSCRDCQSNHIFTFNSKIWLIDFEGACRIPEIGVLPRGSQPYLPPSYRKQIANRRRGTLENDYALGVILFQFLSGEFPATGARV